MRYTITLENDEAAALQKAAEQDNRDTHSEVSYLITKSLRKQIKKTKKKKEQKETKQQKNKQIDVNDDLLNELATLEADQAFAFLRYFFSLSRPGKEVDKITFSKHIIDVWQERIESQYADLPANIQNVFKAHAESIISLLISKEK